MSGSTSKSKARSVSKGSKTPLRSSKTRPRSYPICTSCAKPASSIYKLYTSTLIVLVRCSNAECKQLVDSYGDEECRPSPNASRSSGNASSSHMSGSWMDLILVKPRAYRHFLYNVPFLFPEEQLAGAKVDVKGKGKARDFERDNGEACARAEGEFEAWRKVIKRLIGLSLVDGYLRWFYLCAYSSSPQQLAPGRRSLPSPYTLPYVFAVLVKQAGDVGHSVMRRLSVATAAGQTAMDVNILQQMGITEKMLGSYLMVWIGTLLETLAMHATVTLASYLYVQFARRLRRRRKSSKSRSGSPQQPNSAEDNMSKLTNGLDPPGPIDIPPEDVELLDLYRPSLIPNALLLSSLTTLLLLSIVLLWESKLPRPDGSDILSHHSKPSPSTFTSDLDAFVPPWISRLLQFKDSQLERDLSHLGVAFSTDFAVRTLLGGLNAGVSLAVIHPKLPILTTSLLLLGWFVAYHVRVGFTLLPSDVGPGGAPAGGQQWSFEAQSAVGWYCTNCR